MDLNNGEASTDEDVARDISNKLYEEKDTLLRKYLQRFFFLVKIVLLSDRLSSYRSFFSISFYPSRCRQ